MEGLPGWVISPMPGPPPRQHKHERQYTPSIHPFIPTRRIWNDDYGGQMIFGDLVGLKFPDICLTGEKKPRKNLTQETCPDRDRTRARCVTSAHAIMLHSGGLIFLQQTKLFCRPDFPCGDRVRIVPPWVHMVRKRRTNEHPMPGGIAGPPCQWGTQIHWTGPPGWGLGVGLTTSPCKNFTVMNPKVKESGQIIWQQKIANVRGTRVRTKDIDGVEEDSRTGRLPDKIEMYGDD